MRVVQFIVPSGLAEAGRHVGLIDGEDVIDVTSTDQSLGTVYDVFEASQASGISFDETRGTSHTGSESLIRHCQSSQMQPENGNSTYPEFQLACRRKVCMGDSTR